MRIYIKKKKEKEKKSILKNHIKPKRRRYSIKLYNVLVETKNKQETINNNKETNDKPIQNNSSNIKQKKYKQRDKYLL